MAKNSTLLLARVLTPSLPVGAYNVTRKVAIPAGVPAGDQVQLFTITQAGRISVAFLNQLASAGVGVTLQLVRNRGGVLTNLTAATAAGAASVVSNNAIGGVDVAVDDIIEVSVAGGPTVAVNIETDVQLQH